MILQRIMSGAAAAGAAAAGGAVITVSLSYALYAFAKIWLVPAASAAVVALVFAAVLGIAAAVLASGAKGKKAGKAGDRTAKHLKHPHDEPRTLLERAMDTARERPVVAAAGALAAGLLALRNPALVATVIGLINQPPRPRRD